MYTPLLIICAVFFFAVFMTAMLTLSIDWQCSKEKITNNAIQKALIMSFFWALYYYLFCIGLSEI